MNSTWSVFVQIFSVIVVLTIAITLAIAIFSYVGYKIRKRKKPKAVVEEIPNFFVRYSQDAIRVAPENTGPTPSAPAAGGHGS